MSSHGEPSSPNLQNGGAGNGARRGAPRMREIGGGEPSPPYRMLWGSKSPDQSEWLRGGAGHFRKFGFTDPNFQAVHSQKHR